MLASVIVTAAREAISDEVVTYRHSDAEMLRYLGRAIVELWGLHPESFMTDDYPVDPPDAPTTLATDVPMDGLWTNAIVHHMASKILAQDSEDENNRALAKEHWAHWLEVI